jgi:hypothetical protein
MSYALFLIAPLPGSKQIAIDKWERFAEKTNTLKLTSENSQLLARGVWQVDLSNDSGFLHQLIIAASEAGLEFRYVITSDQLSWIYSSNSE